MCGFDLLSVNTDFTVVRRGQTAFALEGKIAFEMQLAFHSENISVSSNRELLERRIRGAENLLI